MNLHFRPQEELLSQNAIQQLVSQRYNFARANLRGDDPASHQEAERDFANLITNSLSHDAFPRDDLKAFPLNVILAYLDTTYSFYMQKRLPEIDQTINLLQQNYDQSHPCILLLNLFFMDYQQSLSRHLRYQQQQVFPYIKGLQTAKQQNIPLVYTHWLTGHVNLAECATSYTDDEECRKVRRALQIYQPSAANWSPYRILLSQLRMFEIDLNLSMRLQEEVLLPKAYELENEVRLRMDWKSGQN